MAANTFKIHLTNDQWNLVATDRATVKLYNPNTQPVIAAVASTEADLLGLNDGHIINFEKEVQFTNMASGSNVFVKAMNSGDAWVIVTATDARLASGGVPQTGLTDSQLRASPVVVVTVDESDPLAVEGDFYPAVQDVNLVQSAIIGTINDSAATSDTASASLIALTKRVAQNITTLTTKLPTSFGKQDSANSSPVTWSNEDGALIGATTESLPANDQSQSGLNGRLKRIAVNISSMSAKFPADLGSKAATASLSVTSSTEDITRIGTTTETPPATDIAASGLNGRLARVAQNITSLSAKFPATLGRLPAAESLSIVLSNADQSLIGQINEAVPATDTDSSGLNGRLQRIAQNISTLSSKFPATLGRASAANSSAVTWSNEDFAAIGATSETAPANDTATSGLNGRLQRVAQRLSTISSQLPTSLGQKTGTGSLSVILASDQPALTITASNTGTVNAVNSTTTNLTAGGTFIGSTVDISAYGSVSVSVFTSHASATDGFVVQQSIDGTNWDFTDSYTVSAGQTKINVPRQAQYFRMSYTNGATATTTFRLQTILNNQMPRGSSVRPGDAMTLQNDFDQCIAVPSVYNGASFDMTRGATNGLNSTGTGLQAAQLVAQFDDASIVSTTENSFGNVRMSADHILMVAPSPTSSAGAGVTSSATSTAAASIVFKTTAGNLYGINVVSGSTAGYLMLFNSTSTPADGVVTPVKCLPVAANSGFYITFEVPLRFSAGITAVFSSTGPFNKTASATAYISGDFM